MKKNITLVGMGPGSETFLTEEAIRILTSGEEIWLRTEEHPCIPWLKSRGMNSRSFDFLYKEASAFEEVYERLADLVLQRAETHPVILALPGNVHVAEKTTERIKKKLRASGELGILRFVHGASFIDAMVTSIGFDPIHGLRIVDAFALVNPRKRREIPHQAKEQMIVVQVYDRYIASEVKIALSERYGDLHKVCVVTAAGDPKNERLMWTEVWKLDHTGLSYDHLTSIYVPKGKKAKYHAEIFE